MADYRKIIEHYESCLDKHGDTYLGVDWPNKKDTEIRYKEMLKLAEPHRKGSLLDFGCGLSHFYEYVKNTDLTYYGLDVSEKFIEASRKKYPQNIYYCLDILNNPNKLEHFDFIVANGVFTEKNILTFEDMFNYFSQMITILFKRSNIGLAFNLMSTNVDWQRKDLFHVGFDDLAKFLNKNLSRNFVFNHNYGLYEYTTYIYK